jgi:hypothetical protein
MYADTAAYLFSYASSSILICCVFERKDTQKPHLIEIEHAGRLFRRKVFTMLSKTTRER